jgi:hypothetical protein
MSRSMRPKEKRCATCKRRPRRRGQRTCKVCHAAAERVRRAGKVLVPRGLVPRGTFDARGRVRLAAIRRANLRTFAELVSRA